MCIKILLAFAPFKRLHTKHTLLTLFTRLPLFNHNHHKANYQYRAHYNRSNRAKVVGNDAYNAKDCKTKRIGKK